MKIDIIVAIDDINCNILKNMLENLYTCIIILL